MARQIHSAACAEVSSGMASYSPVGFDMAVRTRGMYSVVMETPSPNSSPEAARENASSAAFDAT